MINTTELHKVLRFLKDTIQAIMPLIVVASSFCICMPICVNYLFNVTMHSFSDNNE